jgi:hypothetical protein
MKKAVRSADQQLLGRNARRTARELFELEGIVTAKDGQL